MNINQNVNGYMSRSQNGTADTQIEEVRHKKIEWIEEFISLIQDFTHMQGTEGLNVGTESQACQGFQTQP